MFILDIFILHAVRGFVENPDIDMQELLDRYLFFTIW